MKMITVEAWLLIKPSQRPSVYLLPARWADDPEKNFSVSIIDYLDMSMEFSRPLRPVTAIYKISNTEIAPRFALTVAGSSVAELVDGERILAVNYDTIGLTEGVVCTGFTGEPGFLGDPGFAMGDNF